MSNRSNFAPFQNPTSTLQHYLQLIAITNGFAISNALTSQRWFCLFTHVSNFQHPSTHAFILTPSTSFNRPPTYIYSHIMHGYVYLCVRFVNQSANWDSSIQLQKSKRMKTGRDWIRNVPWRRKGGACVGVQMFLPSSIRTAQDMRAVNWISCFPPYISIMLNKFTNRTIIENTQMSGTGGQSFRLI